MVEICTTKWTAPPRSPTDHYAGGKATTGMGAYGFRALRFGPSILMKIKIERTVTSTDFYPTILDLQIPKKESQTLTALQSALQWKVPTDKRYIFTYFPHATKVPDTFPNSAAIYDDEWKLIRLLHNAPNGDHEHWLFQSKKDIGEKMKSQKAPKKSW